MYAGRACGGVFVHIWVVSTLASVPGKRGLWGGDGACVGLRVSPNCVSLTLGARLIVCAGRSEHGPVG